MRAPLVGLSVLCLIAACATHRTPLSAPSPPIMRYGAVRCGGPLVRLSTEDSRSFDEVAADDLAPQPLVDGGTIRLVKCPNGDLIDAEKIRYGHAGDLRWTSHQSAAGADFDYFDASGALVGRSSIAENGGDCEEGRVPAISATFVTDFDLCDPALHAVSEAGAAPPPARVRGFIEKSADKWQPCIVPIAKACVLSCPSYDEVLRDATEHVVPCDPKGPGRLYPLVRIGTVGNYRFIDVSGGYTGTIDWFDASGALIGERRSSDALTPHACTADTAIYGKVRDFEGEPTQAAVFCRRDPDNFPNELFTPLWRNPSAP